jgi:hypothetical protein
VARERFLLGQNRAVPHVIALDPEALRVLLVATGPLTLPGQPAPVSADTLLPLLRSDGREAIMAGLAAALAERLRGGPLDLPALASGLLAALDGNHILVSLTDPVAAVVARRGWDGAVRPGSGDFLMLVDTDVGYSKVASNIATSITYSVDLGAPDGPQAELLVRQRHLLPGPPDCTPKGVGPDSGRYTGWMRRCLWDYMRILVPGGSQLLASTSDPTPASWLLSGQPDDGAVLALPGPGGTSEFSTLVVVPQGQTRTVALRYGLPPSVVEPAGSAAHYRLLVQQQPGRGPQPLSVTVRLPPGATLLAADPPATRTSGQELHFALTLGNNQELNITYQPRS